MRKRDGNRSLYGAAAELSSERGEIAFLVERNPSVGHGVLQLIRSSAATGS